MKPIYAALMAVFLFGCANNGTGTIGNGQIDVDIGDGKLFGNDQAYIVLKSAAQIALYEKPLIAQSALTYIASAKKDVADLEQKYTVSQATELATDLITKRCGIYCNTVLAKPYIEAFTARLSDIDALEIDEVTYTLTEFLTIIEAEIKAIRDGS